MTIALHVCCGPCLIEPYDGLSAEDDVVVVFANPNIAPPDEYVRRRDALREYAGTVGARVVELEYEPATWEAVVAGVEDDPAQRCAACYRLRLRMTGEWAVANGVGILATTLTVSPHQDTHRIREAGQEVAQALGIEYLHKDFRDVYASGSVRAREIGLYRQNYCGCLPSRREADEARKERRARRRLKRDERAQHAPERTSDA